MRLLPPRLPRSLLCPIGILGAFALTFAAGCGGGGSGDTTTRPAGSAKFSSVDSRPITECIKDNATGLVWEVKSSSGLRSGSATYTHFDSTVVPQLRSGTGYVPATQAQVDAPTNSIGYRNAINAAALCGYTNWRLPSRDELKGLVEPKTSSAAASIDTVWFPNTPSFVYWTASPFEGNASYAWLIDFFDGEAVVSFDRNAGAHIRLVR